jgi:hypothetical protein
LVAPAFFVGLGPALPFLRVLDRRVELATAVFDLPRFGVPSVASPNAP